MRRRARLCQLMLLLLLLSGCWSRIEVNDLAVVIGMGVDKGEHAPVRLTLFAARSTGTSREGQSAGGDPAWVVAREAQNVADAMRAIALAAPRRLSLHHLRVVLIGEDYARDGIGELMDLVGRHTQIRLTSRPLVVRGRAETVLVTPPQLESLQPEALTELIQAKGGVEERFKDFIVGRISKTRAGWMYAVHVVPRPVATPGSPRSAAELYGMGIFRDDKLRAFLAPREAQALQWLLQNPREAVISSPCPGDGDRSFSVAVDEGRSRPIPSLTNNQLSILVMTNARVNLIRSDCPESLMDPATRQQLQFKLQADLTDRLNDATRILQANKVDPVGFGTRVQLKFPEYWRRIEDEWPDVWARTPVSYSVKAVIHHSGLLIDPVNRIRGELPAETP